MSPRVCSVAGCGKPHNARGWCSAHYRQHLRHNTISIPLADTLGPSAPHLDGAACLNNWELFDPQHDRETAVEILNTRHRAALAGCARCPALAACTRWVDSLPARHRPLGVTAARIRHERPHRRRAAAC